MPCTESDKNRLHRLVNNPYLADVKFIVGSQRKRIYGHRTLLSCASEVFQTMFSSKRFLQIRRNYLLVSVPDVDPSIFLDVLYYIYCGECDLSNQNVKQLFYAAAKFQIHDLQTKCAEFVALNAELGELLKHPSFLQLRSSQVKEIVELTKLKYSNHQLLEALDRWIEHQPEAQRSEIDSLRLPLLLNIESDEKEQTRSLEEELLPRTFGAIVASNDVALYGMGIRTGLDCSEVEECEVRVDIKIGCCEKDVVRESIQLRIPDKKRIAECFFRRIKLSDGDTMKFTVQISGMPPQLRQAWCADNSERSCLNNQGDLILVSSNKARFVTPIAYLIYEPLKR